MCFTENVRGDAGNSVAPERKECNLRDGEITNLDVVPAAVDNQVSILVTYTDGSTFALNDEFTKTVDVGRPAQEDSEEYEVESAAAIDTEAARRGLLKNREDASAILGQLGGMPQLQWRIVHKANSRQFQLFALKLSALDGIQNANRGVTLLMSHDLTSSPTNERTGGRYELHAASGTLYELTGEKLGVYDLSGTVPRLVTRIGSRSAPVSRFARLSNTSVLAVGGGMATVYETKFGSVQGSTSLMATMSGTQPRKRKHEEIGSESGTFDLLNAFSELGLAVGISGSELMALQLQDIITGNKRSKRHGTRLADVIGKGTVKETRAAQKAERRTEKWELWKSRVDELVAANDMEGLEAIVADDKKLGRQRQQHHLEDLDQETGMFYDDTAAYEELWPLPETFDPRDLDRNKILYLLSKIFSYGDAEDSHLEVAIQSPKLIEWLALTGFLSTASIRKAFKPTNVGLLEGDAQIQPGNIMAAVGKIDEDFQLTHDLLHLAVHLDIEEIIEALRMILQSFSINKPTEAPLALPAPPVVNGDVQMVNGDAESELEVAEDELDHAVNALTAGLEVRSDALRAIFARLHALHPSNVTSAMRKMMSQEELFFLLHILRIELADGGWTSRYIDIGEAGAEGGMVDALAGMEASGPSDESIRVIGFLLNCGVDAIGVGGWLVGLGSNWSAKELVESLRAEVSAGYEGCLEASTVQTFLAEVERFSATAGDSGLQYGDHYDDEMDDETERAVLPIGGRAVAPIVHARNDKGARKSKVARAQEKSRNVGKYVFERIRI